MKKGQECFPTEIDKWREIVAALQSTVINPMEDTAAILRQNWQDGGASTMFYRCMDEHREKLLEICRQLQQYAQDE